MTDTETFEEWFKPIRENLKYEVPYHRNLAELYAHRGFISAEKMQAKKIAERDARIAELEADRKNLEERIHRCHTREGYYETRDKLKLAVEALRFYADKDKWEDDCEPLEKHLKYLFDAHHNDDMNDRVDGIFYGGKTAREALKQIGETE